MSTKVRAPKSTKPAQVSSTPAAPAPAAPAAQIAYCPNTTLFVLSGKAHTVKQVQTKQCPIPHNGAAWRQFANTAPSMRSQVMACLIAAFGQGSFTIAQAVAAIVAANVPTGNRKPTAYGNLLVQRGYVVAAS